MNKKMAPNYGMTIVLVIHGRCNMEVIKKGVIV